MAQIFPSLETIRQFKVQPTEGEWTLLRFLDKVLDDNFEVYFKPFINGDRPDLIILKKHGGVFIIEVRDWDLDLCSLDADKNWCVAQSKNEKEKVVRVLSPIEKCNRYKDNLFNLYSAELLEKSICNSAVWGVVTCGVYFHNSTHQRLVDFLVSPFSGENKYLKKIGYTELIGRNDLNDEAFNRILGNHYMMDKKSVYFDDELYESIHRILQPSFHMKNQGKFIRRFDARLAPHSSEIFMFSKKQDELIFDKQKRQQWRVKGVVGSGKTTLLAAKAVQMYKEMVESGLKEPRILILTFNITLRNFIRDKLMEVNESFAWKSFTISNYHAFIRSQINNLGIARRRFAKKSIYQDYELFASHKKNTERFDVIFIDEIQDYKREWMNIIKDFFLVEEKSYPRGGYYLLGDVKQNIYNRETSHKDVVTNVLGVHTLDSCFRSQLKIKDLALGFQQKFFDRKYEIDSTLLAEEDSLFDRKDLQQGSISYEYLRSSDLVKATFDFIDNIIEHRIVNVALNDISILGAELRFLQNFDVFYTYKTNRKTTAMFETYRIMFMKGLQKSHYFGLDNFIYNLGRIIRSYESDINTAISDLFIIYGLYISYKEIFKDSLYSVCNRYGCSVGKFLSIMAEFQVEFLNFREKILELDYEGIRRNMKFNFQMNTGNIKISSIHSFKGWESDTVFLLLPPEKTSESFDELIYTGLTRARSKLFIINLGNNEYHEKIKELVDAYK